MHTPLPDIPQPNDIATFPDPDEPRPAGASTRASSRRRTWSRLPARSSTRWKGGGRRRPSRSHFSPEAERRPPRRRHRPRRPASRACRPTATTRPTTPSTSSTSRPACPRCSTWARATSPTTVARSRRSTTRTIRGPRRRTSSSRPSRRAPASPQSRLRARRSTPTSTACSTTPTRSRSQASRRGALPGIDDVMTWYERETDTLILRPLLPLEEKTEYAVVAHRSPPRARRAAGALAFPGRVPPGAARERAAPAAACSRIRRARTTTATSRARGLDARGLRVDVHDAARGRGHARSCATVSTARARSRACRRSSRPQADDLPGGGQGADDRRRAGRLAEPARVRRAVEDAVRRPLGRRQAGHHDAHAAALLAEPLAAAGAPRLARRRRLLRHRHLRHAVPHRRSRLDEPVRPLPRQLHRPARPASTPTRGTSGSACPRRRHGFGPPFHVAYWHHGTTLFDTEMFIHAGRYAKNGLALVSIDAPGHGLVLTPGSSSSSARCSRAAASSPSRTASTPGAPSTSTATASPTREASSGRRTCSGRATTCGRPWSTRCR